MVANDRFFISYIQIQLIIKTAYLLEAFKSQEKIFEYKIVQVEISLTIADLQGREPWILSTFT